MKRQINIRASDLTLQQIEELMRWWNTSRTETLTLVIDRVHKEERERQKKKSQ